MDIDLIKRSIRLDRQRLQDTSSDLLIQKTLVNSSDWEITGDKRKDQQKHYGTRKGISNVNKEMVY